MKSIELAALVLIASIASQKAWGVCTSLVKGPVAINVKQCSNVAPETQFPLQDPKYSFIRDLPPANRKMLYDSYRGMLLKGVVMRSQAVSTGLSEEKGALQGDLVSVFIPPGGGDCQQFGGKSVQAQLEQICCEGGGNSPCLLDTPYILKAVQLVEKGAPQKALAKARSPAAQALYTDASKKLKSRDFKGATKVLETLRSQGQLDVQGQYVLGKTYRDMDRCTNALPVLAQLHKMFEANDYWVESEPFVRGGTFLYARCLSVTGNASEAVLVLQGFLGDAKKYKKELTESLSHPDFGYISTSKPYIKYKPTASQALGGS